MVRLILVCMFLVGCGSRPYVTVGAGYKVSETEYHFLVQHDAYYQKGHPLTARIDIGLENGDFKYGLSHHSQWIEGWPVNDNGEYEKTEFFIDYTYKFNLEL